MRCANSERGCQWTGTIGTLDDHVTSCQFALVPCPNKCEENKGAGELLLIRKHLEQHLKTKCPKRAYECPHCGEKGTFASITEDHDQVCEKKIVACPNKKSGCSLSMKRGKTKEHVSSDCEYTEVACAYESLGCGVRIVRKDKPSHESEAREKHMDLSLVNFKLLSVEHNLLTAAINLSDEKYESLEKSLTLKDKEHKSLAAEHKSLTEEHRKLSKKNERLIMKLSMLSHKHDSLSMTNELLKIKLATLSEKHDLLSNQHEVQSMQHKILCNSVSLHKEQYKELTRKEKFVYKVPKYASKKERNEIFFSTPIYTHPSGYKMCIRIDVNGCGDGIDTHVSVFTKILAGSYDNQLHWPFLGTVTYELLNQLEDGNHHSKDTTFIASNDMRVGMSRGYLMFLPHSSLGHNPATNTQYLVDDTLYFRVSVRVDNHKPWLVCTDSNSNRTIQGSKEVIFRVAEYNNLKSRNMVTRSSPFYTSFEGYLMCIQIDANGVGDSEGTHVSVFTRLLEGRYDSQLHWPFLGTVKYELLNQLEDYNHHSMEAKHDARDNMRANSTCYGYNKFIPHSYLGHNPATNTQYLLDDTLYFRVSVKVDNHKPWLVCTELINTDS